MYLKGQHANLLLFRVVSSVNDITAEVSPGLPVPHACGHFPSCHKTSVLFQQIDIGQTATTSLGLTLLGLPEHKLAGWKLRVAIAVPCKPQSSSADFS